MTPVDGGGGARLCGTGEACAIGTGKREKPPAAGEGSALVAGLSSESAAASGR